MLTRRDADYYRGEFAKLLKEKERVGKAMEDRLRAMGGTDREWERLSDVFRELEGKKSSIKNHLYKHGYDLRHWDHDKYLDG